MPGEGLTLSQVLVNLTSMLPERYFEEWAEIRAGTRACAELVPDDKLEYTPHADMMNLGTLNAHIIGACYFLIRRRLGIKVEIPPAVKERGPMNREVFLEELDRQDEVMRGVLEQLTEANLAEESYQEESGRSRSKSFTLWHIGEHEIHHRGQLKMYLKMLGCDTSNVGF